MKAASTSKARKGARPARQETIRHMRSLVVLLPQLQTDATGDVDLPASPPEVVRCIAEDAETVLRTVHLGIAALGNVMVYAGPELEDGTISSDTVEALGWLLAELGDFAAECLVLASRCRRETADYCPPR